MICKEEAEEPDSLVKVAINTVAPTPVGRVHRADVPPEDHEAEAF